MILPQECLRSFHFPLLPSILGGIMLDVLLHLLLFVQSPPNKHRDYPGMNPLPLILLGIPHECSIFLNNFLSTFSFGWEIPWDSSRLNSKTLMFFISIVLHQDALSIASRFSLYFSSSSRLLKVAPRFSFFFKLKSHIRDTTIWD